MWTHIFLEKVGVHAVDQMKGKHKTISLEQRLAHILIDEQLQWLDQRLDAHLCATAILQ